MELVDTSKVAEEVRLMCSIENIPAWVGTKPQVTSSSASDAQKTDQCLSDCNQFLPPRSDLATTHSYVLRKKRNLEYPCTTSENTELNSLLSERPHRH